MSSGLMSAMRLMPLSCWLGAPDAAWPVDVVPPPDWLIAFSSAFTVSLFTITPSTTYSGSAFPLIEVTPRTWIWRPPPGAPPLLL